jgi:hypothetical protein
MEVNKFGLGATGTCVRAQSFFSLSQKPVVLSFGLKVKMCNTLSDVQLLISLTVCMNLLYCLPADRKKNTAYILKNSSYIITTDKVEYYKKKKIKQGIFLTPYLLTKANIILYFWS